MSYTLNLRQSGPSNLPALVLIGSLGADLSMWDMQRTELSDSFRVVALDIRGHGQSPAPEGPYTIDSLADDVMHTLDENEVHQAFFVGLSIGGAIVQSIALRYPERVKACALVCTAAKFGTPEAWIERAAVVREQGTAAIAEGVAQRWFTDAMPEQRTRFQRIIAATNNEGYAGCAEALSRFDSSSHLAEISQPTLVLAADQDQSTPVEVVQVLADNIPNATWHVVEGAAHLVNIERCAVVNAHLRKFFLSFS